MKGKYQLGRKLTRSEMKNILGGEMPPEGGGGPGSPYCGLVCNNCAALSQDCSYNPEAFCEVSGQGVRCCHYDPPFPNPYAQKYCGPIHHCPAGNYCS